MESQVKQVEVRKEGNKELRQMIDLIMSFDKPARFYWINALVKQGKISQMVAGRLIMQIEG